jgi:predicted MPP superfamily phosphohydrolase
MSASGNRASSSVRDPRWTKPSIVRTGDPLAVTICPAVLTGSIQGALVCESFKIPLAPPIDVRGTTGQPYSEVTFAVPGSISNGLYDLELFVNEGVVTEPHCVWVVRDDPNAFRFAHISDLHIMNTGDIGPLDRSKEVERLMAYLKREVKPDLIINTGDLISRYGPGKKLYSPRNVRWQMEQARALLLSVRIPQFVSPGNHDKAFPYVRQAWDELMGAPPRGGTDDYLFDYGGIRFISVERSITYNDEHEIVNSRMTSEQKQWLSSCLEASGEKDVVLFCHYDYTNELARYLDSDRVKIVLFGHSDQDWIPEKFKEKSGGLESAYACRIYDTRDGMIDGFSAITKSELYGRS